jgi:hypothetical protein
VTEAEHEHLAGLARESPELAAVNRRVAELGGRMLDLRDGTPAPPARREIEHEGTCPHGHGRAIDCPICTF